eukprot:3249029-Pleurochrysis_carterae.AAC.1
MTHPRQLEDESASCSFTAPLNFKGRGFCAGFCVLVALLAPQPHALLRARASASRRLSRVAASCAAPCALLGVCALLCMHGVLALRRNNDWRSELSLLASGVEHQPTNSKLQYNLGRHLSMCAANFGDPCHG